MSAAVKGKSLDDVQATIATFKNLMTGQEPSTDEETDVGRPALARRTRGAAGVAKFPVRIKCATLAWNTLAQGLQEIA